MNETKQKHMLEYVFSSPDLYARCVELVQPDFFSPEIRPVVKYVYDYYGKHHALPKMDRISAEFEIEFKTRKLDLDDIGYITEECEKFAKYSLVKDAISKGLKDIAENRYDALVQNIINATQISVDRDVGIELYTDTKKNLEKAAEQMEFMSTGILELDKKLGGGVVRQQTTMFSANSGVGKSVAMSNIGANMSIDGYHVVYISLELGEPMVLTRLASIATSSKIAEWRNNIDHLSDTLATIKDTGAASFVIKRLPNGSSANKIRAFLKQYELVYKRKPDVIIIDYLDIMSPNAGIGNMGISEQDKAKSEEVAEIAVDYNAHLFTASQQNRSGITNTSPDQAVIAGGLTKINIVDNYISIYMTPAMRLEGIVVFYYLKTRSSSGVGENSPLKFNRETLEMVDPGDEGKLRAMIGRLQKLDKLMQPDKKKKPESLEDKVSPKQPKNEMLDDEENDFMGFVNSIHGK